jgi:hypothetical protein
MADASANAQQAFQLLVQMGYQPHHAAGIVGNLMQESTNAVDPTSLGDKGRAFGIAQWRDSRRQDLHRFAAKGGMNPNSLETQVRFLDNELRTTERPTLDAINRSSTPEEAASAFLGFERPTGYSQRNPQLAAGYNARLSNAANFYGQMQQGPNQPPESQSVSSTAPMDQSQFSQTQPRPQSFGQLTVNPITGDPMQNPYPYTNGS